MPIPVSPVTYSCTRCEWKKTVMPKGDVLIRNYTWFNVCPKCGNSELERRPSTILEIITARLHDGN